MCGVGQELAGEDDRARVFGKGEGRRSQDAGGEDLQVHARSTSENLLVDKGFVGGGCDQEIHGEGEEGNA